MGQKEAEEAFQKQEMQQEKGAISNDMDRGR
jgi:hypothetical protein